MKHAEYIQEQHIFDLERIIDSLEKKLKETEANLINTDKLIGSLGEPEGDNEYRIIPYKKSWWIEHKHVGSGEPLKQWILSHRNSLQQVDFKVGDKVRYQPEHYGDRFENGIVKEIPEHDKFVLRVVYNCLDDWDNYRNYTAAITNIRDIKKGWL
jgi:hypothetical protein